MLFINLLPFSFQIHTVQIQILITFFTFLNFFLFLELQFSDEVLEGREARFHSVEKVRLAVVNFFVLYKLF